MRQELKKINGERDTFTATFSRYGSRTNWNGFQEKTYLLKDIKDKDGRILTDHLWIKDGKRIGSLGKLKEGDIIQFDARVAPYSKVAYKIDRWYEKTTDYTLKFPTNFKKLKGEAHAEDNPDLNPSEICGEDSHGREDV